MSDKKTAINLPFPEAPTDETASNDMHGHSIPDPFRPLEDSESEETKAWIDAHNDRTKTFLSDAEQAKALPSLIEEAFNYPRQSPVRTYGSTKIWSRNDGLQPQAVYYYQREEDETPQTLFNPMEENEEGRVFVQSVSISPSGRYAAIQTAWDGKDTSSIRIFDMEKGTYLEETVENCRYSAVIWSPDEKSFIYNQYIKNEKTTGSAPYIHILGEDCAQDQTTIPHDGTDGLMIRPGKIIGSKDMFYYSKAMGTDRHVGLSLSRYDDPSQDLEIVAPMVAKADPVAVIDGSLYMVTDLDAPNNKLVRLDPQNPEPENWETIIDEGARVLEDAFVVNNKIYTTIREGMSQTVEIYSLEGDLIKELDLPQPCDVGLYAPIDDATTAPLSISTYLAAPDQYEYNFDTDTYELVRTSECPHNLKDCEVTQGFATSDDGTEVPYVMIHQKDMKLDGENKTILYGYGGFNIPMSPSYSTSVMAWVRQGGVYVVAGIRGGSEYGHNWWKNGAGENKLNCSTDFASVAKKLHQDKVTSPKNTIIKGGSNGGTLVATTANRYPDLFGGVYCAVGVHDLLRYHLDHNEYSIGKYWKSDFNDPEDPQGFQFAKAVSPLHNVRQGGKYPAMIITTASSETRVEPFHSYKLAATLLTQADPSSPIYLDVASKTGHGAGKSVQMMANEIGRDFAFYEKAVGPLPKPEALEQALKQQRAERDARVENSGDITEKKSKPNRKRRRKWWNLCR